MDFSKTIATRKSTRSYKEEQIKPSELRTILLAGCAAPVGFNAYDTVHMTAIKNQDLLKKIAKCSAEVFNMPGMNPFYAAPTLVIVSAKKTQTENVEYANAGCITQNMTLAATDLGIGSVFLWGFILALKSNEELLKEFNLPEGFVPISAIALGYPTEELTEEDLTPKINFNIIE